MPGWMIGVLVLAFIGAVAVFFLFLKKKKKAAEAWKFGAIPRALAMTDRAPDLTTPKGISVWLEPGLDRNIDLEAIDAGFDNVIAKLICAGYQNVDRAAFRPKVAVLASVLSPESHTPSYKVFIAPGDPYYGSEFDLEAGKGEEVDHYVLAAGQMVAVGDPLGDIIAIAHPQGNSQFTKDIVDFENEHIGFAHYDGTKFEETKTHGIGRGHPVMDPCPAPVGFYSSPVERKIASDVITCPMGEIIGETPLMKKMREGKAS